MKIEQYYLREMEGKNNGDNKLTVTSKSCTNAGIIVVYYNL